MATNNAVDSPLAGTTGTGNFVGSNTPTITTPIFGTSISFSPTTGGIIGTTTNNNTSTGYVGEFVSSVITSASPVSLTSGTIANITSISLTAGDWNVWGNVSFGPGTGTAYTTLIGWISSSSATLPDSSLYNVMSSNSTVMGSTIAFNVPQLRFSISGTTTIYLSVDQAFSISTLTGIGGIYARRAR